MKLTAFQQKKLRQLGSLHSVLHERTLGISRGISDRQRDALPDARRQLMTAERRLAEGEQYAAESRDERFKAEGLPDLRERAGAARALVGDLEAEVAELEKQREAASADSSQSGKVFEAVLKAADAKKSLQAPDPVPRVRDTAQLGRELNAQASAGGEQTMLEREIGVVEASMRTRRH